MAMPAISEALDIAARQAWLEHGIRVAYVFDIASELGPQAARGTLDHALNHPPDRLVGFGLGGIEQSRAGRSTRRYPRFAMCSRQPWRPGCTAFRTRAR